MRVLAFTVSYNRPYLLRHCVTQMAVQKTHARMLHAVSVTDDVLNEWPARRRQYLQALFPELGPGSRTLVSFNPNRDQHRNYLSAITSAPDWDRYDLYVKIDDDDVYKQDYVERCVRFHARERCDISSSAISAQINGVHVNADGYADLGGNPPGSDFRMPQTFAFNRRALAAIMEIDPVAIRGWEDGAWRDAWVERGLVHKVRDDGDATIWHIHGGNVSVGALLQAAGPLPGKTVLKQFDCRHRDWAGRIYLYDDGMLSVNTNGDTGTWTIVEGQVLRIHWDRWPPEVLWYDPGADVYRCREKPFVMRESTRE